MANTTPIFQSAPKTTSVSIANSDTTAEKVLYTAGSSGALVDSIAATSIDTSPKVFNLYINDGSTSHPIGQVSVAAGAGTNGTVKAQNLLTLTDIPALQAGGGLALGPNQVLKIAANATLTSAKTATFTAIGGDY